MIDEEHYKALIRFIDKQAELVHPDYGPCDALVDGYCSMCTEFIRIVQRETK